MEFNPIDRLVEINGERKYQKTLVRGLLLLMLILSGLLVMTFFQEPLVIVMSGDSLKALQSKKTELAITTGQAKEFVTEYIRSRFTYNGLAENVLTEVMPYCTDDQLMAIKKDLKNETEITQTVANIAPTVTEREAQAKFDKIIRVKGVPILVPSEISLQILKGHPTAANPWGLFVSGEVEHAIQ